MKSRPLKPEEAKIWHRVARTAKPLKGKTLPIIEEMEELLKPEKIEVSKAYSNYNAKHQKKIITSDIEDASHHKRVRRGNINIDATIDLHGMTQEVAQMALNNFIINAVAFNYRAVLVITGKGDPNPKPINIPWGIDAPSPRGIIRQKLREWLHAPILRKYIAAVSVANLKHGGSGAFYVLLKAAV